MVHHATLRDLAGLESLARAAHNIAKILDSAKEKCGFMHDSQDGSCFLVTIPSGRPQVTLAIHRKTTHSTGRPRRRGVPLLVIAAVVSIFDSQCWF